MYVRMYPNKAYKILQIPYKMNIWQQFNLANQSFLSDWWILYWRMLLYYMHALSNKREFSGI